MGKPEPEDRPSLPVDRPSLPVDRRLYHLARVRLECTPDRETPVRPTGQFRWSEMAWRIRKPQSPKAGSPRSLSDFQLSLANDTLPNTRRLPNTPVAIYYSTDIFTPYHGTVACFLATWGLFATQSVEKKPRGALNPHTTGKNATIAPLFRRLLRLILGCVAGDQIPRGHNPAVLRPPMRKRKRAQFLPSLGHF